MQGFESAACCFNMFFARVMALESNWPKLHWRNKNIGSKSASIDRTLHCAPDKTAHYALPSSIVLLEMICDPFQCNPIRSLFTPFLFSICIHELRLLLSNIKTNCKLPFDASVLNDLTNNPPKICCQLSGHYLFGNLDCRTIKEILRDENQHVLLCTYNPIFFKNWVVLPHLKSTVFQAVFKNKSYYCLTFSLHSINVKKSEIVTTASFRSFRW